MNNRNLIERLKSEMKAAMRSRNKLRLQTIRLIQAEFKRVEVDERIEINDERALNILDKMLKQRRDSLEQFRNADRQDLAEKELLEIKVIQEFLPEPLSKEEIEELITEAFDAVEESGMKAMGKMMGLLKPKIQGRADAAHVSNMVKSRLVG